MSCSSLCHTDEPCMLTQDGRCEFKRSEEYRHQCEVRTVLRWRHAHGAYKAHEFINAVEKARGKAAAERLMRDCQMQWSFGNRGQEGQWLAQALRKQHQ